MPPDAPQVRRGWRDYALLLALACCWSSTYPLTKFGLGSISPITFISARSLVAAGFLFVILRARGLRVHPNADVSLLRSEMIAELSLNEPVNFRFRLGRTD